MMSQHPPSFSLTPRSHSGHFLRVALLFAVLFFGLQYGYQHAHETVVEYLAIDVLTVRPSAWLLNLLNSEPVWAEGHRITTAKTHLSVLNGCEGIESIFLIVAAILAYPSTLRQKAWGLWAGISLIYVTNQLRIVGLFFAVRYDKALFNVLHGFVLPTFIVLVGGVFYLFWLKRIAPREA